MIFKSKEDAPLREDVRLLGEILGEVIKKQVGIETYNTVEEIRNLAKVAYKNYKQTYKQLVELLENLPLATLTDVIRAFSHFLNYANVAEQYHRIRKYNQENKKEKTGTIREIILELKSKAISKEEIFENICHLDVGLVLTAHPTEVKRRTLIKRTHNISHCLEKLEKAKGNIKVESIKREISREMTAIWLTPDIRDKKPTPIDEVRWGLAVVEQSLWNAIPKYLRQLDSVMEQELGINLPPNCCPIRFDSWIGGDRDGNPLVTAEITYKACYMSIWMAMDLYLKEINKLKDFISIGRCNKKLFAYSNAAKEPYRFVFKELEKKLKATRNWASENLKENIIIDKKNIIQDTNEILNPLNLCYESLLEIGADNIARGELLDLIRRVECFGLSLLKLDIRQSAHLHNRLMQRITSILGLGDYVDWPEVKKQEFLTAELFNSRTLIPKDLKLEPDLQNVYDCFVVVAKLPAYCFSKYIISMASRPSDILLVMLFQQEFSDSRLLPVVPLFETLKDLENSAQCLDALLSISEYRNLINNNQEVMIGYSDSAKDAGILSASWWQYCAQERMIATADKYGINLSFFHGRGGSVGRGGWPTHAAINSLPPGTLRGNIRVTQQGEVIDLRFGIRDLAIRTLDIYSSAMLKAVLVPPVQPQDSWRALMNDMSRISSSSFQKLVHNNKDFEEFFNCITPCRELSELAIGSRPQAREPSGSLASLRAIPWVFAWTQNRMLLPAWYGVAAALEYAKNTNRLSELKDMKKKWPFLDSLLSMVEMVLAKSEINITKFYETRLLPSNLVEFGEEIFIIFNKTKELLLEVLEKKQLLKYNASLQSSVDVRNPYLLPLHLLQVELLSKVRDVYQSDKAGLNAALLISIAGIAAGMKNSG